MHYSLHLEGQKKMALSLKRQKRQVPKVDPDDLDRATSLLVRNERWILKQADFQHTLDRTASSTHVPRLYPAKRGTCRKSWLRHPPILKVR
jgi:hypothetical protein